MNINRDKKTYRTKKRQNQNKIKGFLAYPSEPQDRIDIIEKAIAKINKDSNEIHLIGWKKMDKNNSRIISNILEAIDDVDFFVGDISGLNPNVLFEAGYAFAKRKKIVLISQGSSTQAFHQDIHDLQILSGWEIIKYENINQLASGILIKDFSNYIPEFNKYLNLCDQWVYLNRGLFLKAFCKHEIAVSALSVFKTMFDVIVDDWDENKSQTLHWYIKAICQSTTILALFIPAEWDNSRSMNAKFSFVCGMAVALNKQVRLIGLPGYVTPVDYQEMMIRPLNQTQICNFLANELKLPQNESILTEKAAVSISKECILNKDIKEVIFLKINLGDSIAENEEHELNNYFITTGQYADAIKRRQAIMVGNKGTGKTAMFYQLRSHFQSDVRNLVCEIKPSDYKMTRFLQTISTLPEGRVDHVLESIWKLIFYCEIILSIYRKLEKRRIEIGFSVKENALIQFYKEHDNIITAPFEQKLEIVTNWLEEVSLDSDNFSKRLHDSFLIAGKNILIELMQDVNKTVILVDNLDKSWKNDKNLDQQAQMVLALLGIHRRISGDLGKNVNISIIIFLRRNIFEYILDSKVVREVDKVLADHIELQWNDSEMLLRVIESRFRRALEDLEIDNKTANIWSEFFVKTINNIGIREWIYSKVFPRPRDLIHFVQKSIEYAINRDHEKILEADLDSAAEYYPGFALEQIISEYKAEQPWLQKAIHSFMGKPDKWEFVILLNHLESYLRDSFDLDKNLRRVVADLIGIGFLGVQITTNKIRYAETVAQSRTLRAMIMGHPIEEPLNLIIHPVFYLYLSILEQETLEIPTMIIENADKVIIKEDECEHKHLCLEENKKSQEKINIIIKSLKALWQDPVWSKVIAAGIIAVAGILFSAPILGFIHKMFKL